MAKKDFLYCEQTDTKVYSNDIVLISSYPDAKFIAKKGWYKVGTTQKNGWYFVNINDRTVIPMDLINIEDVSKDIEQGTSELKPAIKDMDTQPAEVTFIVIPGTNIRLYEGDIVKITNKPRVKWIVHSGWYIYNDVQNFGWYFECIKNGEILPVSVIDLTLVILDTTKTQGSGKADGKVVNYTRPFTVADAELLNRAFITLDTIAQRDNIDPTKLVNGRMVRVNDVGGVAEYYAWNAETSEWEKIEESGGHGIPELIGTAENPIILADLEPGLYRVKGTYKVSQNHPTMFIATIDHIVFVNADDEIDIKVITEKSITDYMVKDNEVIFINNYATEKYVSDNYATKVYVDDRIAVLEDQITEILLTFHDKVVEIVNEVLGDALNSIDEGYIDNLFDVN